MKHTAKEEDLRVQSLSPLWQTEEWKSTGPIWLKGFQDHEYFLPCFALVFQLHLFRERQNSPMICCLKVFLYRSQSQRDVIMATSEDLSDDRTGRGWTIWSFGLLGKIIPVREIMNESTIQAVDPKGKIWGTKIGLMPKDTFVSP